MNLPNLNAPPVTAEDRARGFAELELRLNDGTAPTLRVHALEQSHFIQAARLSQADAMIELACKALRESPEYVRTQVSPLGQMHLLQTLTALVCSEDEAAKIIEAAGQAALANTPHPEIKTMNDLIQAPLVTEADVLAGVKTFPVRTRKGAEIPVTVRAASWRAHLLAAESISRGDHVSAISTVLREQPKPLCDDTFLDGLVPNYLPVIVRVAMELANGVPNG